MIRKLEEKEKAISLRKKGFSYGEILRLVPVAKSSLSLWLKSVGLSKPQKQRLTEKKLAAAKRGGLFKKRRRIEQQSTLKKIAAKDITHINKYELFLIGTALYWAEGSKQKEHNPSVGILFSNSDALMIKLFLVWLRKICKIKENDIYFEIYIHETADYKSAQNWWANELKMPIYQFQKVYFKKNKIKTNRKNTENGYHGILRIKVRNSSKLNRKITGWIEGITRKAFSI